MKLTEARAISERLILTNSLKYKDMGSKSPLERKRYGLHGHTTANLDRRELRQWITAASALLPDSVCAEFAGVLSTLPTARPQGSVNGLKPTEKADCILAHISKQRGNTAPRLILAAAAGVLAFEPMPTSSPMFLKVQTGRAIYRLLRADYLQLYGKAHRVRIAMQSHRTARELFKLVEPVLYFWLKDGGRAAIARAVTQTPLRKMHP